MMLKWCWNPSELVICKWWADKSLNARMELVNEREYQRWRWNLPESKHKQLLCHFLWNHFMRKVHSCWVKCIFGSANKYLQSTILVSFQLNAFIVQKKVVKPATCNQIPKLAKILMTFPRKEAVLNEFAASLYSMRCS